MQENIPYLEPLVAVILLIIFSLIGRVILESIGQRWATTFSHTSTIILLPVITYIITKVITGNIALSLGMVGALSIVRFRNPVRSPLELSVYFASITMGIAASVSIKWLIHFIVAILLAILFIKMAAVISRVKFKREFFHTSFSEGNSLSILEIEANNNIHLLDNNKLLISKKKNEKSINYVLASSNFKELQDILSEVEFHKELEGYQLKAG